jgi:hypothetical protein
MEAPLDVLEVEMSTRKMVKTLLIALSLFISFSVFSAQLRDFDGQTRTLGDYTGNGKWTVVMIWHSTCKNSNAIVHEYVDFHMFQSDKNATVMGISLDGYAKKTDAIGFIEKHDVNFPNLIGDYDEVTDMIEELAGIQWKGTPTFMIYSPKGELRVVESGRVPAKIIGDYITQNSD